MNTEKCLYPVGWLTDLVLEKELFSMMLVNHPVSKESVEDRFHSCLN